VKKSEGEERKGEAAKLQGGAATHPSLLSCSFNFFSKRERGRNICIEAEWG
jgi:hypothetical protein